MSSLYAVVAISLGSIVGGLSRYGLGLAMNSVFPPIPLGTLAANLIAAYIIGTAIAFFSAATGISPAWRLFIITGLCGGLSTFSTFSAELLSLLREARLGLAACMLALHVGGSLLMAALGMASVAIVKN